MGPLALAAIGAGVGLAKGELIDRPKEARQRRTQAEIARYSPWSGLKPTVVQEADPFANALNYGLTGAMMGQANPGMGETAAPMAEEASTVPATTPAPQGPMSTEMSMQQKYPWAYGGQTQQGPMMAQQQTYPWNYVK